MRIGLYNRHLATLGGGERYSLAIAGLLSRRHAVDVINHVPVPRNQITARLQLDLARVDFRVVPERPAAALGPLTAEYDLFINASNLDFIPAASPFSALVVYFPLPPATGAVARLRRRMAPALRRWFILPEFCLGVGGEERKGAAAVRRVATAAAIELPAARRPYTVHFGLCSAAAPQAVTIAVDGQPQCIVTVGPGPVFLACLAEIPGGGTDAHRLTLTRDRGVEDTPVELVNLKVDHPRHLLYRRWFAARLPEWDRRLQNLQPADIRAVAHSYTLVWAISRFTQRWIEHYWRLPSALLYPPVDVDAFPPKEKQPWILSVGRFFAGQHNKRHLVLIQAFRQMVDAGLSGWQLHLAGGANAGPDHARYLAQVNAAAQGYPIVVHADAPFEELVSLYGASAVYWHAAGFGQAEDRDPIRFEHFGITTVEAMAAGCVPVVIDRGGQRELFTHGLDGFGWVTTEQLQRYTRQLIEGPDRRRTMAAAARAGSQRFDQAHFQARLAETFAAAKIPVDVD